MEQPESESKTDATKQVPKMPNEAVQNESSSPDSGHPSSRNFSITSGLSDGSFSTEDSSAPDASQRSTAAPLMPQISTKPAGGEGEGLTTESQVAREEKGKGEEGKTFDSIDKGETTLHPGTRENKKSDKVKKEESSFEDRGLKMSVKESPRGDHEAMKSVEVPKREERNVRHIKETEKFNSTVPFSQDKEHSKSLKECEEEQILGASTPGGAYSSSRRDETQALTESDESPSAIEMEEIPKTKVSMAPWSRRGHCETSSFSEDSAAHVELRQEVEKLSPEGTESLLSEPEMESLYPPFDSLPADENTKNEVTPQESTGSPYSVCTPFFLKMLDLFLPFISQSWIRKP